MKPTYASNASVFARRGNPWVSEREGREGYGRNLDTEDPDLDMFTRAKSAKRPYVPTKTGIHSDLISLSKPRGLGPSNTQTPERRFAQINAKLQAALRANAPVKVKEGPVKPVPPARAAAKARGRRFYLWAHTVEGEDIEAERDTPKDADRSFLRFCNRADIVKAELWDAWTGRVLKDYSVGGGTREKGR